MHDWLCAVIQSIEALPKVAAAHFTGYYHLGDAHFHMDKERRTSKWRKLIEELHTHVCAARTDPSLQGDGLGAAAHLSERRETRGERIITLCDQLSRLSWGTSEFDRLLSRLSALGEHSIRSDISELKRLSSRKQIANFEDHNYLVARCISHMRHAADRLHHLSI